jgi:hypothetical protein
MERAPLARLHACADTVHRNIWSRFVGPDNVLYDYAGLQGEVLLPTPEECAENKPNAFGWWSPIENGAFFNGDYLLAQCARYERLRTEESRDRVQRLVAGLYLLQDVCVTPGMIARGVGSDGACHYPCASHDQVIPWLLGLWRYLATDIPTAPEREECRARLLRELQALQAADWRIPGERPGFERGNLLTANDGSHATIHIALATKLLAALTDDADEQLHRHFLDTPLPNGKTRRAIIAAGFASVQWESGYCWFTAHSQYAVRELYRREANPAHKHQYRTALQILGHRAAEGILRYRDFPRGEPRHFTPDWHGMLSAWRPQTCSAEGDQVAGPENALWSELCPAVCEDKATLHHALPAAWMVTLSEDPALIRHWLPEIVTALEWFDYDQIHYGTLFFAENVIEELSCCPGGAK